MVVGKSKQEIRRSWTGFEEYRDRLLASAKGALDAEMALDEECRANIYGGKGSPSTKGACALNLVVHAIKGDRSIVSKAAEDNARYLKEICEISGLLVGSFNFDPYFVQREYESVVSDIHIDNIKNP